ncbi:MAG TPA: hypothetical protein VFY26_06340 [Anaerolineales bacterium]|nr:hypothetical protein [Anaerolineales bacterium]
MSETIGANSGEVRKPFQPGRFVLYKTQSGRTLFARKPGFSSEQGTNGSSASQRETVRNAVTYAEFASGQAIYQSRAVGSPISAYNLAVADYLGKPQIMDIEIRGWTGGIGQTIRLLAKDNFMVLRVHLVIRDSQFVWEAGEAEQSESNKLIWTYITRAPVEREPGLWLEAYAYDLPGNIGEYRLELR